MTQTVIEKEIYGSSLCWWPSDPTIPTGAVDSGLGESWELDVCSVELWRNRDADGLPGKPMKVTKFSLEPLWASSNISPVEFGGSDYWFKDVLIAPFINYNPISYVYAFSATDDLEFKLNQNGPATALATVNDVHFDDAFVLQPEESIKVRLYGAQTAGGSNNAVKNSMWTAFRESVIFKMRIEMEPWDERKLYFSRTSFNQLSFKSAAVPTSLSADQELVLLDLRPDTSGSVLNTNAFSSLTDTNQFTISSLDFRASYPWGGYNSGNRFMYSIILNTEGNPEARRFIRKYVRYSGGDTSDLEINGLLKDIGPINMKKGQFLTVEVYTFEFQTRTDVNAHGFRQMPALWLNGSIT